MVSLYVLKIYLDISFLEEVTTRNEQRRREALEPLLKREHAEVMFMLSDLVVQMSGHCVDPRKISNHG